MSLYETMTMTMRKNGSEYLLIFQEFFLNVKNEIRNANQSGSFVTSFTKWEEQEIKLMEVLLKSKKDIHDALCGKFL